ncbi:T9SS type A sorting domain-containing protein [Aegicerativicinus sediminis]|uniref:T9SS type A sorting domain-containing protein n=1 Tax=Aegicerativicinus sediminis TaxID=2893202 RepID=UPI001E6143B4|nr:T9SS type A sorting domain-containing protein [Aegicerativicinus sediminis]
MVKKLLITFLIVFFFIPLPEVNALGNSSESGQFIAQFGNEFTISPNPATTKLNINLKSIQPNTHLTIIDVLGKKVLSKEISELETTIDVSRWNAGVYLVRISNDKETQTKRFVKQ